jgi:hypothetical protein
MFLAEIESLLEGVHDILAPSILMERTVRKALDRIVTPHDRTVCYRASSIGKPWVTQVLDRWAGSGIYSDSEMRGIGSLMVMTDGVLAQAWVETTFDICKIEYEAEAVLSRSVGGIEIIGHSDIIARKGSQIAVLECKSMAPHLITSFAKLPNDDFGYLSQLAFYTDCVRKKYPLCTVSPAFVLYNRGVGRFKVVPITNEIVTSKVRRVDTALEGIASIKPNDVEALLELVVIPPTLNGKIPTAMKFSRWYDCLYEPTAEYGQYRVRRLPDAVEEVTKKLYKLHED